MTLIEILIVISIVAVLAVMLATRQQGNSGIIVDVEANRFAAAIRNCYTSAVIGNKVVRMKIDAQNHKITYEGAPPGTLMAEPKEDNKKDNKEKSSNENLFSETKQKAFTWRKDVTLEDIFLEKKKATENLVYCFPQGYIQELAFHIKDNTDAKRTIEVQSLTGKTEITRGYKQIENR